MKRFGLLVLLMFSIVWSGYSQTNRIKWLTLEDAYEKTQKVPKKILIDVYTDWCGWCKVMDKKTFSDAKVADYVNKNYYAVKLNAETREDIKIGQNVFKFNASQRSHDAAIALLKGQMSYPSIVYLDEQFQMIQPVPGYMEAPDFLRLITFLGGNHYKKESFDNFKAGTYKKVYGGR